MFKPSINGLHFPNTFQAAPIVKFTVPLVGDVDFGDASAGLCGGMVEYAKFAYEHDILVDSGTKPPQEGSLVFKSICDFQVKSLNLPLGPLKWLVWMGASDEELFAWTMAESLKRIGSLGDRLQENELVGLSLVTVQSLNPRDLSKCHQVLAYDISLDKPSKPWAIKTIHIYDPNYPDRDDITISVDGGKFVHSEGMDVRGFFLGD